MPHSFIISLIQNISLLLVFSFLYEFRWIDNIHSKKILPKIYSGVIIGAIGIFLMFTPWIYKPGIVFDTRSVLISISGLYLGIIPTAIAVAMTGTYRIIMGGDGVWMGVSVIFLSGLTGVFWKLYIKRYFANKQLLSLLLMGIVVHLLMLSCAFLLPDGKSIPTLKSIYLPVLTVYPVATVLLGILMNIHVKNWSNNKANEKLIESERRFSDMLENINLISVIVDKDYRITFCNEYFLQLTAYSIEEILNKDWLDLFVPDDEKEEVQNALVNLSAGNSAYKHYEHSIVTKFQNRLKVSWNNTILRDGSGKIIGTASIGENITERHRALEALRKSEDKFNKLFQLSPDAVTLTRLRDRIIIEVNDSASELIGFSRKEIIGEGIFTPKFWVNKAESDEYAQLLSKYGKVSNFEARFRTKDGRIKTALVSGEIIPIQDEEYVIGVIRDITRRKEAEQKVYDQNLELQILNKQLKRSVRELERLNEELKISKDKAEENNRLKSVFLQNISHEIRTPMNGIMGFINLLKDTETEENKRDLYIDIISKSGNRLMNTVDDLIEISKIETKQIKVYKERMSLSALLGQQYTFYKSSCERKGLVMNLNSPEDIYTHTDKHLLDSIISNLLSNAVKFTKEGYIEIGSYRKDNLIIVYVKDTGIGIPENRKEAIFDRFVQANLELTRTHEGSGLGLSIAKAYAQLLEASISLESEPGKGSTFFIELPGSNDNSETISSMKPNAKSINFKSTCTILLVEDDEISTIYMKNLLAEKELEYLHVSDGRSAVETMKNNPEISLILMDIKLPVMDGIEATKQIRTFNNEVPIIAQTAYAMKEDRDKLLEIGCTDYIAKPILGDDLFQLLDNYLVKSDS